MELAAKAAVLHDLLEATGSLMVAYSGGTDSAWLAFAAHRALGPKMLAVIADSPSLPRQELAHALAFTAAHGIPTRILQTQEMESADYRRNDAQRCFHCKDELFTRMKALQAELGFRYLAYGMNLDDRGEFRPGQKAASEHGVLAPLVSAGLTKAEVRALSREAGLAVAEKAASACLSSRLEYGRPVTVEALSQVERAEEVLHGLGFAQVRVRHHGELARVEIAREDLPRVLSSPLLHGISAALKALGFRYVTLDMDGYRSGSMNDVLPLSALTAAQ